MLSTTMMAMLLAAAAPVSPNSYPGGRIVGGVLAGIEEVPYQLSLQKDGHHTCGASVISELWALTAAHCVHSLTPETLSLRAGTSTHSDGGTVHKVVQITPNAQFNSYTHDYDIALLKVERPFQYSASVQPIALQDDGTVVTPGTEAVVSGWGTSSNSGSAPTRQLFKVAVPVWSSEECDDAYRPSYHGITGRMICAGMPEGGKDACRGDSGGPLVAHGKLVGIVSWGAGCAQPGLPGVYAQVAALREWIEKNLSI